MTKILSDDEIKAIPAMMAIDTAYNYARAIEQAILSKLNSAEPIAWRFSKGTITKLDSWPHGGNWKPLYEHPPAPSLPVHLSDIYEQMTKPPAPSVPAGYQLVPIEPTEEMIDAMIINDEAGYHAMYYAALSAAARGEE